MTMSLRDTWLAHGEVHRVGHVLARHARLDAVWSMRPWANVFAALVEESWWPPDPPGERPVAVELWRRADDPAFAVRVASGGVLPGGVAVRGSKRRPAGRASP